MEKQQRSLEGMSTDSLLVVGGTGFIGHHLVKTACDLGWYVVSISRNLPTKNRRVPEATYITADLSNTSSLDVHDLDFDYVVNLGGSIEHKLFFQGGQDIINSHFKGLLNLVNCLDRRKLSRFVYIGSSDEYGDLPAPQSEMLRERPISPYAFAKTAATQFLQMLYRTEGFPTVTLRLFLTYGPGQKHNRLVPQVIRECLMGHKFPVSEGMQIRDFCYVEDIVTGILATLKGRKELDGKILNLASGKPVSIREVILLIQSIIGKGEPIFGALPYRHAESMELYADISKIKDSLGWTPKISLATGLERTIDLVKNEGL
jgi:nucleoside-diphosphate-sugar epimerase